MKLKTSDEFIDIYKRMLKMFLLIDNNTTSLYIRCMLTFYGHLHYWSTKKLPMWSLIRENLNVLNEETGEIALSTLASIQLRFQVF